MIDAETKNTIVPEFTLKTLKMSGQHMTNEQLLNMKDHECDSSRRKDCADCQMQQAVGGIGAISSQGDSESQNNYGTSNSQYYDRSHVTELRDQITHLETVNSKLVPDLEKYEAEIYDLKHKLKDYQSDQKQKDRECYKLQQ